jgi:hypothetical protein
MVFFGMVRRRLYLLSECPMLALMVRLAPAEDVRSHLSGGSLGIQPILMSVGVISN